MRWESPKCHEGGKGEDIHTFTRAKRVGNEEEDSEVVEEWSLARILPKVQEVVEEDQALGKKRALREHYYSVVVMERMACKEMRDGAPKTGIWCIS